MWILPKNYQLSSAFAADMVELKEDLTLLESSIESSLMWRSKPTRLQTWLQRWNRVSWIQHLFTRILKPSHHTCFEELLTSSLEVTRASRLVQQVTEKEQKTKDIYGLSSEITSKQLNLPMCSSKTSKVMYRLDSPQSSVIWKKMVSKARLDYSLRNNQEHGTNVKGFLFMPTPTTHLAKEKAYPAEWTRKTPTLTAFLHKADALPPSSGYVNPEYLEWLMGVPIGWTDIDF